jgi:thiol:disulfide interchange protein DsbC
MATPLQLLRRALVGLACLTALGTGTTSALADDAAIRKNLSERLTDLPKIDEIQKSPIPGLYEVRIGTDIFYTDEQGNYLIEGQILETKTRTNLTEARINKLTAIDFATLPLKDAIVWKQGTGARKLVVFADPNCSFCKKFERELTQVKDVTVYTFLYPILGGDSPEKSKNIWCAKDNTTAWRDWMLNGAMPARTMGQCDVAALARNVSLGRKHRVTGTPALVFEDGKRIPGAMSPDQVEKQLVASGKKTG